MTNRVRNRSFAMCISVADYELLNAKCDNFE